MKRARENNSEEEIIRAMREGVNALSVSKLTSSKDLMCRSNHIETIISFLESPNHFTMQVFGMPGTGKTATVHSALAKISSTSTNKPTAILLNGYVVQKSTDVYWTMYTHFCQTRLDNCQKCSPEESAGVIEKHFREGWKHECKLCVIVIDEVDKVLEKHAKALFKVIDWLSLPHAHCKLITISNSMELALDAKTRSRLDVTRQLVFLPYGINELKTIFEHRVHNIIPRLFTEKAINFLCHQTSVQYGDVRRLLQAASAAICNVLIRVNNKQYTKMEGEDGIISVQELYPIVRKVFHDRFVEFIKSVHNATLYIVICLIAKESGNLLCQGQHESEHEGRILLERLYKLVRQIQQTVLTTLKTLTKIAFYDIVILLREVALIDISTGKDCIPLYTVHDLMFAKEDVYISIIQPYQTIINSCKLHDTFGSTIGVRIL